MIGDSLRYKIQEIKFVPIRGGPYEAFGHSTAHESEATLNWKLFPYVMYSRAANDISTKAEL